MNIYMDTEGAYFEDAPDEVDPLDCVCFTWCEDESQAKILHAVFDHNELKHRLESWLLDPNVRFVGHYILRYDIPSLSRLFPEHVKLWADAVNAGRVTDTWLMAKLQDIAIPGVDPPTPGEKWDYSQTVFASARKFEGLSLADQLLLTTGKVVDKSKDTFRLRYAELMSAPIYRWPKAATDYALEDARCHRQLYKIYVSYYKSSPKHRQFWSKANLLKTHRTTHTLSVMTQHGVNTDRETTEQMEQLLTARFDEVRGELCEITYPINDRLDEKGRNKDKEWIFGRRGGLENRHALLRRVLDRDGNVKKITKNSRAVRKMVWDIYNAQGRLDELDLTNAGAKLSIEHPEFDPEVHVSSAKKALIRSGDEVLATVQNYNSLQKATGTYIKAYKKGFDRRLYVNYNYPARTGRTTSNGDTNIQNQMRAFKLVSDAGFETIVDVRSCFVPSYADFVLIGCDYDALEMRTLAQSQKDILGHSILADLFISDPSFDPHSNTAGTILNKSYDWVFANKNKEAHVSDARGVSKIPNFGVPGGMGAPSLVEFAYSTYGMVITLQKAKYLIDIWHETYPDMELYFNWVSKQTKYGPAYVVDPRTGFVRGGMSYCACANHMFQSPAARLATDALDRVTYEQYHVPSSDLYGTRPFAFIHDEIIIQSHIDQYKAASKRLRFIMEDAGANICKDVPIQAEPVAMRYWSKGAKTKYDSQGELTLC